MQELLTLLDKDLIYDRHEIVDENFVITAHSGNLVCRCRCYGKESASVHSVYQRSVQDLPIQGHTTTIVLTVRKMFCKNPQCGHKTFSFLDRSAQKTNRLKEQILNVALETNLVAVADTLKREAIQASKSTVRLLLKKSLLLWITDQVTEVCVDDFALRKDMTYGMVIIDSKSHRVIDMIPSRERQDVAAKLAEYANLKVVSRDGSPTYAVAITEADPQILQISDRFHLLKGLTGSLWLRYPQAIPAKHCGRRIGSRCICKEVRI